MRWQFYKFSFLGNLNILINSFNYNAQLYKY